MVTMTKNSFDTEREMGERLNKLLEDLPVKESRALFEELIDDYCLGVYGVSIVGELKRVRLAEGGKCISVQPLANGRAILVSAYGFKVKSESECKCGRAFLVLDEMKREDNEKERN